LLNPPKDIRGEFTPDEETAIKAKIAEYEKPLSQYQLRKARNLTMDTLAKTLKISQGAVAAMEKSTDMYISTMRSSIEAMGGELQITAIFSEGTVKIEQFENVAEAQDCH
jgi:DNA-binding XRE family transcriptional regulator